MRITNVLKQVQSSIEWTYDKLCDIYGNVEYTKPNGADAVKFDVVESGVKCRLSALKLDNTEQGQANELNFTQKLFCNPNVKIEAGSRLVIDGVKFETTHAPKVYDTHMEVLVIERGWI